MEITQQIYNRLKTWLHILLRVPFFRTTPFRLTFMYLGVFSSISAIVFGVVYISLVLHLQNLKDTVLLNSAQEYAAIYKQNGLLMLKNGFQREATSQGTDRAFFQLFSANGNTLASSDMSQWQSSDELTPDKSLSESNQPIFHLIRLHKKTSENEHNHGSNFRLISMTIDSGDVIQIGQSIELEESTLNEYQEIFSIALVIMVACGGFFGFFLARKAMMGVKRVTDTATSIGRNDLGIRVPLSDQGNDINELAQAFNGMLERIEILLGEFQQVTDNVAHELRTPITRIRGIAETTLKGNDDLGEYKEMAASIIDGCDDLIEMISTMLEIAKTDSGSVELQLVPLDLNDLIEEAVDLFAPMAEDKGITIQFKTSLSPMHQVMVNGDRRRLQRVISNLLDNAIKYTPYGGMVTLTTGMNGQYAAVMVTDTGTGIDHHDIPHIFERFYRADKSRSTAGSGLGLSLAESIVNAHHGRISVESSAQGSIFTLSLPLKHASQLNS